MNLDVYYRFERLDNSKSKARRDLTACSEIYNPIHYKNGEGKSWIYLNDHPDHILVNSKRQFELSISRGDGKHISGIIFPDPEKPHLGYGDIKNTFDALLFVFNHDNACVEIFIAKNKKNTIQNLYFLLCDGELDEEIQHLREQVSLLQ